MQPVLLDSSVYISVLRRQKSAVPALSRVPADTVLWLSAVVLEELYAGASERDLEVLERLERDFGKARRIIVPVLSDWIKVGKVLARVAAKYDYEAIGRARLTNDALIALSAARCGVRVITANAQDFLKIAEFHTFAWQLEAP